MGRAVAPTGRSLSSARTARLHGIVGDPGRTGCSTSPLPSLPHRGAVANDARSATLMSHQRRHAGAPEQALRDQHQRANRASLFRYSKGHGGLYCSACHGSPRHLPSLSSTTTWPACSTRARGPDVGVLVLPRQQPDHVTGGPHGMHRLAGQAENNRDRDYGRTRELPGLPRHDLPGNRLSRSFKNQTLNGGRALKLLAWPPHRCYD
jgi:hypothetical protein